MYNFLVTSHDGAWDLSAYEYDRDRFLEYSAEKEKALFKSFTAESIELLKSFPCLFTYEGCDSEMKVGYLRSIKDRGRVVLIEYEIDPEIQPFNYSNLESISTALDIRKPEMSRTHWAVKDENLFQRLHEAGLVDPKFINHAGESGRLEELKFKVAFSFPGELRDKVNRIASKVKEALPKGSVFYDDDFIAQLARPNLDSLLQNVYLKNSDLVVVFLSGDYEKKMWCGIEWRAIRTIINNKSDHTVMIMRADNTDIPGVFPQDGFVDINRFTPEQIASFVLERVRLNDCG